MADPRAEIRELLVEPPQFRDEDRPVEGTFEAETSDVIREQAADDLLNAYRDQILHEAAERIRRAPHDGTGDNWGWWDAAEIPDHCANLIDPSKQEQP